MNLTKLEGAPVAIYIGAERHLVYPLRDFFLRSIDTYVYLIHLDQPIIRSNGIKVSHYLGSTQNLTRRILKEHARKRKKGGAPLLKLANQRGICWQIAKIWQARRDLEFLLKRQRNHARYCPICQAQVFKAKHGFDAPPF